ncbi:hypothetical protein QTN25_001823 [Entamoeba marina]
MWWFYSRCVLLLNYRIPNQLSNGELKPDELNLVDPTPYLEYKYNKFINLDPIKNDILQNYSVGVLPFFGGKPQQLYNHENIKVNFLKYGFKAKNDKWSNYGFHNTNFDFSVLKYETIYSYSEYQRYITIGHLLKSNMEIIKNTDYVFIQPLKYTLPPNFSDMLYKFINDMSTVKNLCYMQIYVDNEDRKQLSLPNSTILFHPNFEKGKIIHSIAEMVISLKRFVNKFSLFV